MIAPSVPSHAQSALRRFDPKLRFEWKGNHWAIVDTLRVRGSKRIPLGDGYLRDNGRRVSVSLSKCIPTYVVVMHLPPDRSLTTSVVDELRYRRMDRWSRPKDFIDHVERQLGRDEISREKIVDDFADSVAREHARISRAPESVLVDGRKD